jgi:hypothetical protein
VVSLSRLLLVVFGAECRGKDSAVGPKRKDLVLVLALLAVAGCTLNKTELRRENLLARVGGNGQLIEPKRCALQVAFLTRPLHDRTLESSIWNAADEQAVAPEVRHALEVNGLRVGLITGALPADVESLLNASGPDKVDRVQWVVPDGDRTLFPLCEPTPTASLLLSSENRAYGKDYQDASGWYRVTAQQEGPASVALRFVPEVHHGPIQHSFSAMPTGGSLVPQRFMVKDGQEEETFRELAATLTVQPGQIAVLGCRSDKLRSLGTFLFTKPELNSDRLLQRVLLVWASRSSQGLPALEPVNPPDMPQPQAGRKKAESTLGSASPRVDQPVQN